MSIANPLPDWPEPVLTGLLEKHVSLTTLNSDQKKQVWAHIQKNNPALAELLTSISTDGDIQEFIKYFGAEIRVSESEIPAQLINEIACDQREKQSSSSSSFSP